MMIRHGIRYSGILEMLSMGFLLIILLPSCSPDHGLGPTVQGIRGAVYFHGTWPEDILEVRVVVSKTYPPESFFDLSGYSDAIPVLSDSASYEVGLGPGEYGFVAVACRRSPNWDTECVLGFYHFDDDPGTPQPVEVGSGDFTENVDITVGFGDVSRRPSLPGPGRWLYSHRGEKG